MWRLTWRDLVFRRRRFVIAAVATALVFAITVLMTGLLTSVNNQNDRVVERFQADTWWVPEGSSGPFTAGPGMSAEVAATLAATPGITRAEPVLMLNVTLTDGDDPIDVNLIGTVPGGLGSPEVAEGRGIEGPGEMVADSLLDYEVGDTAITGGRSFTVVGLADGVAYLFGIPTVFLAITDVQAIIAAGQPVANAIVTQGTPTTPPAGLQAYTTAEVQDDLGRVLGSALSSVTMVKTILVVVAAGIVAFIIYLSSLERTRDVAVLKATGATNGFISAGLVVQGVIITLGAVLVSVVFATLLEPVFPLQLEVTIGAYVQLLVLGVVVGLAASLIGVRRALTIDPAMAFG